MMNGSNIDTAFFRDREEAAMQVADTILSELFESTDTVVIGISEGGTIVADILARSLRAEMDILLTEPIPAPNNAEVAIAMVSETQEVVMHKALVEAFEINEDFVYNEAERKYEEEVLSYVYRYRKGEDLLPLKGKSVILADECIESGLTMMVALKSVIAREAKNIYIAAPILDKAVYENLLSVCDGVFCPHKIEDYISVEYYYETFDRVSFEEIETILDQYRIKHTTVSSEDNTKDNQ